MAEEPADEPLVSAATAPVQQQAAPDPRIEQVVGAVRTLDTILGNSNRRISALESVAQQLPQMAGIISALIRALGARMLALIGLLGCLALAFTVALNPSWQNLAILAIVAFGVQLPLVLVTYLAVDRK